VFALLVNTKEFCPLALRGMKIAAAVKELNVVGTGGNDTPAEAVPIVGPMVRTEEVTVPSVLDGAPVRRLIMPPPGDAVADRTQFCEAGCAGSNPGFVPGNASGFLSRGKAIGVSR
jgi:hypothetical protein